MKGIFSVILLCGLLGVSTGLQKCLRPPAAPISDRFLTSGIFNIVAHSICDNCDEADESFQFPAAKTPPKGTYCWHVNGKFYGKESNCKVECTYNSISEQLCIRPPGYGPPMKGSNIITKTDNSTYFVAAICRFGKQNFWYIASHNSVEMSDEKKDELIAHVGELGFKTDDPRTENIQFNTVEITKNKCTK